MTVIEIPRDKVLVDEDSVDEYVDMLNGIVRWCREGGWTQGYRNTVAVDLTVGCVMLGLDPMEVLDKLVYADVIRSGEDDEDTATRIERVLNYQALFDWEWMIDPEMFVEEACEKGMDGMPIEFRLA
jgi:hypothetical protein